MRPLLIVLIWIAAMTPAAAAPVEIRGAAPQFLGDLDVIPFDPSDAVIRDGRFQLGVLASVTPISSCIPGAIEAAVRVRIHLPKGLTLESGCVDSTFALEGIRRFWTVRVRASHDGQYFVANELAIDYANGDMERGRWVTTLNVFNGQKPFGASRQTSAERIPKERLNQK